MKLWCGRRISKGKIKSLRPFENREGSGTRKYNPNAAATVKPLHAGGVRARIREMKRFKIRLLDCLVLAAAIALVWNDTAQGVSLGLIATCIYLLVRSKFKPAVITQTAPLPDEYETSPVELEEDNTFLVNDEDLARASIELDVNLDWKPLNNHFRLDSRYDTCFGKSLYEYRVDGTEVFVRLVEDESEDMGREKQQDVRDGVVQESAIRERSENKPYYVRNPNELIVSLKQKVEWQKLDSWGYRGFKFFLLSKKLPKQDARRFLRQELERLRKGTAAFFREAGKYGLEEDDNAIARLRFAEGKPRPTDEEMKRLFDSTESFGITQSEFESGKKIIAQLEQLLAD